MRNALCRSTFSKKLHAGNIFSYFYLNMYNSDYTIEVWLWGNSSLSYSTERLIIECGNGWTPGTYQLTSINDSHIKTDFYGGSSAEGCGYTADWTNSEWHYVAGVLNSSANSLSVYYDGVLGNFVTENNQPDSDTAVPMYFASREGTSLFSDIKLDEVRISNISRSSDWMNLSYLMVENQSNYVAIGDEEKEAHALSYTCGDICVNRSGWWRNGGLFNASSTPIQHSIDNATVGDTICVKEGTYNENVCVDPLVPVGSAPVLAIGKSDNPEPVLAGSTLNYC